MGQALENLAASVDCETSRHPVGVCVGHHAVQFPVDGAAVDVSGGHRLRQHVRPQAVGKGAAVGDEAGRTAHARPGCRRACSTSCTATRRPSTPCSTHPLVRAISFVGSTGVARHVYETGTAHGKRVQAAGGAKNHLIIMPDADLDQAVKALQASAFGCAGERCMAGSVAVPVGRIARRPRRGPVSRRQADEGRPDRRRRGGRHGAADQRAPIAITVATYLDVASGEGAEVALDGRAFDLPGDGFLLGPSVVDRVRPTMRLAKRGNLRPGAVGGAGRRSRRGAGASAGNASTATGPASSRAAAGRRASSSGTSTPA